MTSRQTCTLGFIEYMGRVHNFILGGRATTLISDRGAFQVIPTDEERAIAAHVIQAKSESTETRISLKETVDLRLQAGQYHSLSLTFFLSLFNSFSFFFPLFYFLPLFPFLSLRLSLEIVACWLLSLLSCWGCCGGGCCSCGDS